jgi:chromosome segregation protein
VFLKALTLKGFKSFADPATLVFEPGVTVVVGPNGSGKSNVVDAVAWVLGAQGPRTVRSSKMEDVIFAGSADRPALGRAEVALTIDNRSGQLPGGVAEITITRILFRSGDSEYAINGQPCRLLDVQELLSDSGVGRQQHVIVSQGQLDQVLNARPEDRRTIIEEAAGVLKHRRRRERAERRLAAADENLERLGDLVREVRRQIRPLERQASAARSYTVLASELRGLRLYLIGQELHGFASRREAALREAVALRAEEQSSRESIGKLDEVIDRSAAELAARDEEDLIGALGRVQGLAERCRGLDGVLGERRRSLERSLETAEAADVVATLEAEGARVATELETTAADELDLGPEAEAVDSAERELADAFATHEAAFGDLGNLRSAQEAFAEARGQTDPLRRALERAQGELTRLEERLEASERRAAQRAVEAAELTRQLDELAASHPRLLEVAARAEATASSAEQQLGDAEEAFRVAEQDRHRHEARAEALERAAAEARGAAGIEALRGIDGVLGTVGDLVDVDSGWHAAVEAALGAALAAVVVDGSDAARQALSELQRAGASGAVLAVSALAASVHEDAPAPLPPAVQAESVRGHVRPRTPHLAAALDRLLADAVAVAGGWTRAVDVALERPDLVVVTAEGDRFAPSGWQMRAGGGLATLAAAEEARRHAGTATTVAERAAHHLEEARRTAREARQAAQEATRSAERAGDRRQTLDAATRRMAAEVHTAAEEQEEIVRHRVELAGRVERDRAQLAELERQLPELHAAASAASAQLSEVSAARRALEERRAQVSTQRRELEVRAASLAERRTVLTSRLQEVERRLAGHVGERQQAAERRRRLQSDTRVVDRLAKLVRGHRIGLERLLAELRELRNRQVAEARAGSTRLEELRQQRQEAETRATAARERLQRIEVELAEGAVRQEAAVEALSRELGAEPTDALDAAQPELPEGVTAIQRATVVATELAALGPVNPLALEELGALEERHQFLAEQVEDLRRSRRELQEVIRAVDDEIVSVFTDAFADVNEHFSTLVSRLFPGGTGRLVLTDPANPLDTGIEVEARPAGKNVRKLSLLSGGERSLVALAFLFAVFRSRPSPFYLMDEVEAALDDVNLHRFLGLLEEFRGEAQLIVVSHQKRTMESADALYGVTMTPGGSSKVVSQKVKRDPNGETLTVTA